MAIVVLLGCAASGELSMAARIWLACQNSQLFSDIISGFPA